MPSNRLNGAWIVAIVSNTLFPAFAQTAVATGHYDNFRAGANVYETTLTPANVNRSQFGKLAELAVSGCVFAQPLIAPVFTLLDGAKRNLLFVATTTNAIYAYDADDYSLYFSASFGTPAPSADFVPNTGYHIFPDCDAGDGDGPIGIVGTPVIDIPNGAMYFVANTIDGYEGPHRHHHYLHKIALATGADLAPPAEISGSYRGVPFQSRYQLQRTALLLFNDRVYIAFASHEDETPYYGWLFSYDLDLKQVAAFNYSPLKFGAGIWQSGGGPATDGRYIYFTTGNLAEDDADPTDNSDSVLQVDPATLEISGKTSVFPENNDWDPSDLDLGSSRVIVIPGTNYAVSGSKYGDAFIVNRGGMRIDGRFQVAARHSAGFDWTGIYNGLAYWNNTLYAWPGGGYINGADPPFPTDTLKAFRLNANYSGATLVASGQSDGLGVGYQGANIAISANGDDPTSGIVWASTPSINTGGIQVGYLHAYNATDFSDGIFHELWNNVDPEHPEEESSFAKFNQPLIANGRVFLPTFSAKVIVYGLLGNTTGAIATFRR